MNWLIWRQYRKQVIIFVGLFLVFAVITIPSSMHFWHNYQHILATCNQGNTCGQIRNTVFSSQTDGLAVNFVKLTLLGLPILLGLFVGVPLIAKEYVDNTTKLVWTQGISRRKWLITKLAWVLLATVAYTAAFTVLATWFSRTSNAIDHDKFNPLAFSSQGIVPVAIAVFAVAVGTMFGAWLKKLLPALGATLGLLIVLQVAVPLAVRPHYQPAQTAKQSIDALDRGATSQLGLGGEEWVISSRQATDSGVVLNPNNPPEECVVKQDGKKVQGGAFSTGNGPIISLECLKSLGYKQEVNYQPAYRYWNFQRIEAALYLALTIITIGVTYQLVIKRDA